MNFFQVIFLKFLPSIDYNHDPKASFFLKNQVFFKNNSEIELIAKSEMVKDHFLK